MICEATVDLYPFYQPRHAAPAVALPRPAAAPSGLDWNRAALAAARFVGNLALDLAICAVTFAVTLIVASAAVDLYLFWRR